MLWIRQEEVLPGSDYGAVDQGAETLISMALLVMCAEKILRPIPEMATLRIRIVQLKRRCVIEYFYFALVVAVRLEKSSDLGFGYRDPVCMPAPAKIRMGKDASNILC
jgi:hypothetical protein